MNGDSGTSRESEGRLPLDWSQAIIRPQDKVLITGASGFIGPRVLQMLIRAGFRNIRCLARPSSDLGAIEAVSRRAPSDTALEIYSGNLLCAADCLAVTRDVEVVYHLAAGRGEKAFADAFLNSVVTTRNLLDAVVQHGCVKRFVSISSFSVYATEGRGAGALLDETCPIKNGTASDAVLFRQGQTG